MGRLGIAGHLSLAFAAVAALVVSVNRIEEHGSLIVRVTESNLAMPAISAPSPAQPAIQSVPTEAKIEVAPQEGPPPLTGTIDRFDREVLSRVDQNTPERSQLLQQSTQALQTQSAALTTVVAGHANRQRLSQWRAQLKAHQHLAVELVRLADLRRQLIGQSWQHFDALDAQTKTALDSAWKILGRVITRQSLVSVSRHLDPLRRDLTALAVPGSYADSARQESSAHLDEFARQLQQSEASLLRSQGAAWVGQLREHFTQLSLDLSALLQTDQSRTGTLDEFLASSRALTLETRVLSAVPLPSIRPTQPPAIAAPISHAAAPAQLAPRIITTSTRREVPDTHRYMVWLSALTLLLLLLICLAAALGIVLPVKHLTEATRRLAQGELHVRVGRGGIKELDSLAVSFNQMAQQLADAHAATEEHHHKLEERIAERTLQLKHLAEHDPLTELPNRRQLFSQLDTGLREAAARGSSVGLFILDLDNFKNINDSVGHAYGDRVLQSVAQRLDEVAAGKGYSARLGGDEFTIVQENAASRDHIHLFGQQLLQAFQRPLLVDGRELLMSVSIGASYYPDHAQNAEELLRDADAALFRAKQLGRNQLNIFSPELLAAAASRFSTEQALRHAIERGEFELAFQPEVRIDTLEVALVEALLRWRLPDGRQASTAEFLTVAEDSGLILEISDWVLRSAIEAAAALHYGLWPGVCVAINVSARQLLDQQFVGRVERLLARHSLPAQCIEIELTENVLQTGRATIEGLSALRALGAGIALDDFGTGFSSLTSLEQLPLTRIKLDRSLMTCIDSNPRAFAIAQSIIELAGRLGLKITAEGIERPEQLSMLWSHEKLHLQGYLLSRPISVGQLPEVLVSLPIRMRSLLLSAPDAHLIHRTGGRRSAEELASAPIATASDRRGS